MADLEAGLNDLIWARPKQDDVVLAVTDGSAKSVEVARRACGIAAEMGVTRIIGVANRSVNEGADRETLTQELNISEIFVVPEDPTVLAADHRGLAPFDAYPDSPAMVAVRELATHLVTT